MYKIDYKVASKSMIITFGGLFTEDEAKSFMGDYQREVSKINKKNTNLILDTTDLKTSKQDTIPMLQACLNMYLSDGFKDIVVIEMKDICAKMQTKRIAKDFLGKVKFVSTLDEALKAIA